jgi:hypothetical protein
MMGRGLVGRACIGISEKPIRWQILSWAAYSPTQLPDAGQEPGSRKKTTADRPRIKLFLV